MLNGGFYAPPLVPVGDSITAIPILIEKNAFALATQTAPQAAFLPMSSLFWLLCLYKSTGSARGLGLGPPN